mmetsp:Transcript_43214/g.69890  ORF Transcript_43214/g.69890 Transcript_43214/m.69890 type:complete len:206 (-) Transcript_43214:1468-2085(-)
MPVDLVTDCPHGSTHGLSLLTFLELAPGQLLIVAGVLIEWRARLHHLLRVILVHKGIAELIVADLAILAGIEVFHDDEGLLVSDHEAPLLQSQFELHHGEHAIMVSIELAEDVPDQRELLAHTFPELLHHRLQVEVLLHIALCQEFLRVVIHLHDLKPSIVDLDDGSWHEVLNLEELPCDLVQVNALLKEFSGHDAHISLRRLVN